MFTPTCAFSGFSVDDLDAVVDELNARGIRTKLCGDEPGVPPTDERGIARGSGSGSGPSIAWFEGPAGNVLSVITEG